MRKQVVSCLFLVSAAVALVAGVSSACNLTTWEPGPAIEAAIVREFPAGLPTIDNLHYDNPRTHDYEQAQFRVNATDVEYATIGPAPDEEGCPPPGAPSWPWVDKPVACGVKVDGSTTPQWWCDPSENGKPMPCGVLVSMFTPNSTVKRGISIKCKVKELTYATSNPMHAAEGDADLTVTWGSTLNTFKVGVLLSHTSDEPKFWEGDASNYKLVTLYSNLTDLECEVYSGELEWPGEVYGEEKKWTKTLTWKAIAEDSVGPVGSITQQILFSQKIATSGSLEIFANASGLHIPPASTVLDIAASAVKNPYAAAVVTIIKALSGYCSAANGYIAGASVIENIAEKNGVNVPPAKVEHSHGNFLQEPQYNLANLNINGWVIALDPESVRNGSFEIKTRAFLTDYLPIVFVHAWVKPLTEGYVKMGASRPAYGTQQ